MSRSVTAFRLTSIASGRMAAFVRVAMATTGLGITSITTTTTTMLTRAGMD